MKYLASLITVFFISVYSFGQNFYFQIEQDSISSCSLPSVYQIISYCDNSPGIYTVSINWNDGTDTSFLIHLNQVNPLYPNWYFDSIVISHDFQFILYENPTITVTDSQGNPTNYTDVDIVTSFDNVAVRNENFTVDPNFYYYNNQLVSITFPIKATNSNGITKKDTIGYNLNMEFGVCANKYPILIELDTSYQNQEFIWYQSPVWHSDSIDFGVYQDYYTDFVMNEMYGGTPLNYLLFSANMFPLTNSSLNNTYYGAQNLNFLLGRDSLSAPDTSQLIRLEFPSGMINIELSDLKNVQSGQGFIQFQPKVGDYIRGSFTLFINSIDSSQFVYGPNTFKAFIVNSNDADLMDDTTYFSIYFYEPCQGNTGTEIDLGVNCSFETWDSTIYYIPVVTKDICQTVSNILVEIQHPSNLIPDTASINYLNYTVLNDSTLQILYTMDQYEFESYFYIPFNMGTIQSFSDSLGFNTLVSCVSDTNGTESCQSFVPLSNCNQIDTSGFSVYHTVNYNHIHLSAYLEYFNCDASDTLNAHMLLPTGVTVLSNNLLNATLNGNVLSFQFTGSAYFELDLLGDSTTFGQPLNFELTYSNQNDTSLSNNTAYFQVQMGADFCSQFTMGEINQQADFDLGQNQFVLNHFNSRASVCSNHIVEKIHFSSNLIPETSGLINPIVNGDTLIFTVPDTNAYQIRFNYITFVPYGVEEFSIEYLLSTDTSSVDNFAIASAYFTCCVCDTISIDSQNGSYAMAVLIAPTQQGTIYIYNETLDCSNQLQLDVELPNGITPDLMQLPGATFSDPLLTIPVALAPYLSSGTYAIPVFIPGTMPAGTLVDIPYTFSNGIDNSFYNNSDTIHAVIMNSYDPNEKLVNKPELISPNEKDAFVYEIHFQNDGNFPAYNITVRDTMDANLDLSTFKMLYSKHACFPTVNYVTREVVFNFPNIMLESSEVDSMSSQGVFIYSISELDNVPNGNSVENTAYIYFDFNPPIVTNTTVNHNGFLGIEEIESTWQVNAFPNPVVDRLYLETDVQIDEVRISTLSGILIADFRNTDMNFIDVSTIQNGFYLVEILTPIGKQTKRIMIQRN